jgi:hypothetical protein
VPTGEGQGLQAREFAHQPLRRLAGDLGDCPPQPIGFPRHEVQDEIGPRSHDPGVGLAHEVRNGLGEPVVAAGQARLLIHPLLDDAPPPCPIEEECMVVDLKPILEGSGVHLGRHPRRVGEWPWLDGEPWRGLRDLQRRSPRGSPLAPCSVQADLVPHRAQRLLHRPAGGRGEAARVPVEPEEGPQRLKPTGVGEPGQHPFCPELIGEGEDDLPRQEDHPRKQPPRGMALVEGKVRGPCVSRHRRPW